MDIVLQCTTKNSGLLYTFFQQKKTKKMPGEFSARHCFIINYDFKQNENLVILFLILLKFDFKFYNQKSHLVPETLSKS